MIFCSSHSLNSWFSFSGKDEVFILLGAWDGDPEKFILSYLTPLGQAFLGKKPGEESEFEVDNNIRKYRVNTIERYTVAGPTVDHPESGSEDDSEWIFSNSN